MGFFNVPSTYLERTFPVATPFLPRSFSVPSGLLLPYYPLATLLLSAHHRLTIGSLERNFNVTCGLVAPCLNLCRNNIDTIFQLSTFFKFQLSIVNCLNSLCHCHGTGFFFSPTNNIG